MNQQLEKYLEKIERYLRTMAVSERMDIVQEIKSEMQELELQNISPGLIIERLGDPKELAKAYLEVSIAGNSGIGWKQAGAVIAYYSMAGIGGMFIFPFAAILSVGLIFGGIISPIAGLVKFAGSLLGFEVPWVMFQVGSHEAPPALAFLLSVLMGILLAAAGRKVWKLMAGYIKMMSRKKEKFHLV